jgi:tetratricopeptide (TPR) repeat protein
LFSLAAVLLLPATAHADWHVAESDHFVIYADDSEKDIRRFSENLERFHSAMEFITSRELETPSPSNRVTIYVVGSGREVRRLAGDKNSNIAEFYIPRAGGSVAFVQDIKFKNGYPHFSTTVLLHEYAHHFLASTSRYALPQWMNEGAAEFFAAASFAKDGEVLIGRAAQHRAGDFAFAADVSVEELLDYDLYLENRGRRHDAFYAKSWLLFHYLTFSKERAGQLQAYQLALANGTAPVTAAQDAFGGFDQLQRELDRYLKQRLMTFVLGPDLIDIGEISIRKLSEGEAIVMPLVMRSKRGVNEEQAAELVPEIREVAAEFPNDAAVLTALAEAEFDSGNLDRAIDAADRALAIDPATKNALVQKGYALFSKAEDAEDRNAAFNAAMEPFSALNAIENDHPLPLMYYLRSFIARGALPPEAARHALERASQLAPFDRSLAMNVAIMQANEGKMEIASRTLAPIASAPHGGSMAAYAKLLQAALKANPEGTPLDFSTIRQPEDASEGEAAE